MMLRLVVLLAVAVACTSAAQGHCCSAGDRHKVQEQWAALWEDTGSTKMKIGFVRLIFDKLFELKPETKALLAKFHSDDTHSGEFQAFSLHIWARLDTFINMMDDPDALTFAVGHLAEHHSHHEGLKKEHFVTIAQILGKGLPRILPRYDHLSWKSCVQGLVMRLTSKLT